MMIRSLFTLNKISKTCEVGRAVSIIAKIVTHQNRHRLINAKLFDNLSNRFCVAIASIDIFLRIEMNL